MVIKTSEDGVVRLYRNNELKLEQVEVNGYDYEYGLNIGSFFSEDWQMDPETGDWYAVVAKTGDAEYDTAYVGKDAGLFNVTVSADGSVFVDEGGRIGGITMTGGVYSGSGICENAKGWYGAGICLTGSQGTGEVSLTGSTFSGCEVAPSNGYTGHGGAIETYGGTLSVQNSMFAGNSAKEVSAAGGAIALLFSTSTITGSTFSGNSAYFGGAVQQQGGTMEISESLFLNNTTEGEPTDAYAPGGGAVELHEGAAATITGSPFTANFARSGGAIYNDTYKGSVSTADIRDCTFSGNSAEVEGGAIWNGGSMKLENVVLATESDTVYNGGAMTFAGVNAVGAGVVNDGRITFSVSAGTEPLVSDLGQFRGTGSYLLSLSADDAAAGALLAASAGAFTGSLSVKLGETASSDAFTLAGGTVGNDLAVAGDAVLRLAKDDGALTVRQEVLEKLVPAVSNDGSVLTWADAGHTGGYWVEIAQGDTFDGAIRIATDGTAFDIAGRAGTYSGRAAEAEGAFTADPASWASSGSEPRQVVSNANSRADIFFASVDTADTWSSLYQAKNTVTGETISITGRNRIRDTFSGSESDANILYLSDTDNGDALFMDDIYSDFGADAARLSLIREVRAGAGDDIVDMTGEHFTAELAGMTVRGGDGDDVLWGAEGGNKLFGDAGNDRITGGTGDDLIAGGAGDDVLAGGGGNDIFTFGENWGNDVVSQAGGGSVTLWFASGDDSKWDSAALTYTDGDNSVTVSGIDAGKITLVFGEAEGYDELASAGAFLGSSSEAVFETEAARTQGILASL